MKTYQKLFLHLFLIFTGFVCGAFTTFVYLINQEDKMIIETLSMRLDVPADADTIHNHVYCNLMQTGLSNEEVENNLRDVGLYYTYITDSDNRIYKFERPDIASFIGELYVFYDENGDLISKSKVAGLREHRELTCDD